MKNFIFLLFIFTSAALFSQNISFPSENFGKDTLFLETLYPCDNNSSREKAVYFHIRERLDNLSVSHYEQPLDTVRGQHSFASNIIVDFPGTSESNLIIIIPVNNLGDSSLNVAAGLALCEIFNMNLPEKTIKIVFTGADYSSNDQDPDYYHYSDDPFSEAADVKTQTGSAVFLQDYFSESGSFLIYLNIEKYNEIIEIVSATDAGQAPFWLLKQASEIMEDKNIEFFIDVRKNRLFKAGYDIKSQTDIYVKNNIPSLYLTSAGKRGKTPEAAAPEKEEFIKKLISFFITLTGTSQGENWERNYIVTPYKGGYFFINEKSFILLYLGIIALFGVFAVSYSKNLTRYLVKIIRHFWVIPFFFFLCFIFLLLAAFTTEFIVSLKGSRLLWIETPFTVFIIKILTALVFFFSSLFILSKIKLPAVGSFYSSSAIFIMLLNLMMFQFISITLSFYALWALMWIIIFSFSGSRIVKSLCIIISYYLIYDIVQYIFSVPALNLCNMLITDKLFGNLLIAAVLLPMIMMILRVLIIQTHIESFRYRLLRRSIYTVTLLSLITLASRYYVKDLYADRKQPVLAVNIVDTDTKAMKLEISSPVKTGLIEAVIDGTGYSIDNRGNSFSLDLNKTDEKLLDVTENLSWFLDRKNIVLDIVPAGNPEKIEITFSTEENSIILDSNYPFTLNQNLDGGEFHIGDNPEFPLTLDILTDSDTVLWFSINLIYKEPPVVMELSGNNMEFRKQVILKKSIYG